MECSFDLNVGPGETLVFDLEYYSRAEDAFLGALGWEMDVTESRDPERFLNFAASQICEYGDPDGDRTVVLEVSRICGGRAENIGVLVGSDGGDGILASRLEELYPGLPVCFVGSEPEVLDLGEDESMEEMNIERAQKDGAVYELLDSIRWDYPQGADILLSPFTLPESLGGCVCDRVRWDRGVDGDIYYRFGGPDIKGSVGMCSWRVAEAFRPLPKETVKGIGVTGVAGEARDARPGVNESLRRFAESFRESAGIGKKI